MWLGRGWVFRCATYVEQLGRGGLGFALAALLPAREGEQPGALRAAVRHYELLQVPRRADAGAVVPEGLYRKGKQPN